MANASDRSQVRDKTIQEKSERKTELEEIRFLMSQPVGRALAARILNEVTGSDGPLPFSPNAMQLARNAGVHHVGTWLLAEIREACPELEPKMRAEVRARENRANVQQEFTDDNE